jgi:spermidine synthase
MAALLIGYGLSGFAALVFEIAWTRVLALLIGSSVYAFSLMLTAFIFGLGLGSALGARFVDRVRDPLKALAVVEAAIGLSALGVVPLIGQSPLVILRVMGEVGESFWLLQWVRFGFILAIMLVPTTLLGAVFPLAGRLFVRSPSAVGRSVGTLYAANTVGSILGSLSGGFLLIPLLGIQHTLMAAVAASSAVAGLLLAVNGSLRPARRFVAVAVVAAAAGAGIALVPAWNPSRMACGPFSAAIRMPSDVLRSPAELERLVERRRVLFHKEGLGATVTVTCDPDGELRLATNGKTEASSLGDLDTQKLLGHVPLSLHANPRTALVIGLASGMTLGAVGCHPVAKIDCVEITPAMFEACNYFDAFNYHVLDDPRVEVLINDGRNHLALTDRRYDVIVSEPSNPWIAGVADLFSLEFFRLCRDRLNPDGLVCIWLQGYEMSPESFRSVVRTFQAVFPHMSVWKSPSPDYLLVGANGNGTVDYRTIARRMREPAVARDLALLHVRTPAELLAHRVMGEGGAARLAAGAPVHTDDNALLEFAAPRSQVRREEGREPIDLAVQPFWEADLLFLVGPPEQAQALAALRQQAARFIEANAHVVRATLYKRQRNEERALDEIREAAALTPGSALLDEWVLGCYMADVEDMVRQRQWTEIAAYWRHLLRQVSGVSGIHFILARALSRSGDSAGALEEYGRALEIRPDFAEAQADVGDLLVALGRPAEAVRRFEQAIQIDPSLALAHNNLGAVLIGLGRPEEARRHFEEAIRLSPYYARAHHNLGTAFSNRGRDDEAIEQFKQALEINPDDKDARESLDAARARKERGKAGRP